MYKFRIKEDIMYDNSRKYYPEIRVHFFGLIPYWINLHNWCHENRWMFKTSTLPNYSSETKQCALASIEYAERVIAGSVPLVTTYIEKGYKE